MNKMSPETITVISLLALVGIILLLVSVRTSYSSIEAETVPYSSTTVDDSTMELHKDTVRTEGVNGIREVTYQVSGSLMDILTNSGALKKEVTSTSVQTPPINKVVARGTKRYQYMSCSDGAYRYYTDEQFKDPTVGFTSKSEDECAKNGNGTKVRISNVIPQAQSSCIDVTSYDYNWNNDVLCTRADGSQYYTSYSGAGW